MSTDAQRLSHQNPSALPAGTRLGEFEVLSLLGVGGFGIVYLAFDHALEREVAVKEYMPASLAGRTETLHVSIRSQSDAETFELGRKSFVNEARLLARFNDPALLKVHRFWEANGTAYMAMPVLKGRTVKEVRQSLSQPPDEAWLRALLVPLLGAIEKLHSEGVYHRDIAPDNIQIEPDGHPVLLDFGAARRVLSDKSQALTAILKPAYAPIEQYAEAGSVKQGPWTDIYALGATLHYLLLMRPPPPATARAVFDEASALTVAACPGCSASFLNAIDWMLAPRPADRPQNVAALREVLEGRARVPPHRAPPAPPPAFDDEERTIIVPPPASSRTVAPPAAPHYDDNEAATIRVPRMPAGAAPPAQRAYAAMPRTKASSSRTLFLVVGGAVLVAAAAAAFVGLNRKPEVAPLAAEAPAAAAPALASASAPSLAPAPSVAPAPVPAPEPTATTSAASGSPAATAVVDPAPVAPVVVPAAPHADAAPARPAPATALRPPANPKPAPVARNIAPAATTYPEVAAPAPVQAEAPRKPVETAALPVPVPPPAKAVAANPEAVCSGRNPLSYFVCMDKECRKSDQIETADCRKWHQKARNPND